MAVLGSQRVVWFNDTFANDLLKLLFIVNNVASDICHWTHLMLMYGWVMQSPVFCVRMYVYTLNAHSLWNMTGWYWKQAGFWVFNKFSIQYHFKFSVTNWIFHLLFNNDHGWLEWMNGRTTIDSGGCVTIKFASLLLFKNINCLN